jgi:general secretion pathway protein A
MLGAFVEDRHRVDAGIVRKAALEVLPEEGLNAGQGRTGLWLAVAAAGVAGAFALFLALVQPVSGPVVDRVADAAAPPAAALPQFTTAIPPLAVAAALQEPTVPAVAEGEPLDDIAGMAMENSVVEPVLPQAGLAAVVEDPLPAAPGLADVLAAASADAPSLAWAGLFRLWGIEAHVLSDEQACAQAPGVGLRCLQASGSWTALTHYDRPALLRLVGNEGRWIPVLVYELLGADVRIQVDGRDMVVPLDLLKQFWYGEYRLLWRTPPNGHAVLRPGDRDADVAWLRQRLQEATGLSSIAPDPAYFDPGLKQLVEEFQRSSDLNADGVAGPRTLINLNNLEKQPTVPRLGVSAAGAS